MKGSVEWKLHEKSKVLEMRDFDWLCKLCQTGTKKSCRSGHIFADFTVRAQHQENVPEAYFDTCIFRIPGMGLR
jgi:hypothetical protein